jgi:hypothetical protein
MLSNEGGFAAEEYRDAVRGKTIATLRKKPRAASFCVMKVRLALMGSSSSRGVTIVWLPGHIKLDE